MNLAELGAESDANQGISERFLVDWQRKKRKLNICLYVVFFGEYSKPPLRPKNSFIKTFKRTAIGTETEAIVNLSRNSSVVTSIVV